MKKSTRISMAAALAATFSLAAPSAFAGGVQLLPSAAQNNTVIPAANVRPTSFGSSTGVVVVLGLGLLTAAALSSR